MDFDANMDTTPAAGRKFWLLFPAGGGAAAFAALGVTEREISLMMRGGENLVVPGTFLLLQAITLVVPLSARRKGTLLGFRFGMGLVIWIGAYVLGFCMVLFWPVIEPLL
jgi:hypothetical protein